MLAGADNPVSRVRNSRSHLRMSLKSKIISKRACEESGRERKRKERTQFSLIIIENFMPQRWYVSTARANHMLATSAAATERPRLQVTVLSFIQNSSMPFSRTPARHPIHHPATLPATGLLSVFQAVCAVPQKRLESYFLHSKFFNAEITGQRKRGCLSICWMEEGDGRCQAFFPWGPRL